MSGGANANLGFRLTSASEEIHIDCRVTHELMATTTERESSLNLASILYYEGRVSHNTSLAFLVPFFQDDNKSAHYLVVVYQIGQGAKLLPVTMPSVKERQPSAKLVNSTPSREDPELSRARLELEKLQRKYSEKHPLVIQQQRKVDAITYEEQAHPGESPQLHAARLQLLDLQHEYADTHPIVQAIKSRIASLEKQEPTTSQP